LADADCNSHRSCIIDTCVNNQCVHTPRTCDDGIDCTVDSCIEGVGCVHTPVHAFCETLDSCKVPICTSTGCAEEPKDCDDGDPCTIDTCFLGECQHTPHTFCADNLRCTTDICLTDPTDPTRFTCHWIVDLSNCGPI